MKYKRIKIRPLSRRGYFRVYTTFRGKRIIADTNDTQALDKFNSREKGWKTAGNDLHDKVVQVNNGTSIYGWE